MEVFLKRMLDKIKNNFGIGLVESLIAIAFAIIIIVSLLTLTNFNIRNSLLVTENQDAINSANLLLENLRSTKDQNFADFYTLMGSCVNQNCVLNSDGTVSNANVDLNSVSPISTFKVKLVSATEIEIYILTQWKVGNSTFSSPMNTVFTNWRSR